MKVPDFTNWLQFEPYGLNSAHKSPLLTQALADLTIWHADQCEEYRRILSAVGVHPENIKKIGDVPFIPVRLFKEFDLRSIPQEEIFKTMMSSGTSGQLVSKIFLDRDTAAIQTKVLSRLMGDLLGRKRLPMLIIDSPGVLKNRTAFSARGAGILGFSMFGQDVTYALDESMALDLGAIQAFLARHSGEHIFVFGFTYMIWQYFVLPLKKLELRLPIEKGLLLHGGGWKKLQDEAVDNAAFKVALKGVANLENVINYYGMVEQTGSLFIECKGGFLHAPVYSDVIVRRPADFSEADFGEGGIIEVLSMLPRSYPGHALLTEDWGTVVGEDDCSCGRLGKYFKVDGRVAKAEVRGCSDTHEPNR